VGQVGEDILCGLVGVMADRLTVSHWELMEQLLWMDSIRGYHSTGVTSIGGKGRANDTLKLAVDGAHFTQSVGWENFSKGNAGSKVLMGHNRWATVGAINAKNAHPFTHSHITMMHNGTLTDQTLLPDYHRFEVDSDNVAYSLATKGLSHTINNLDGAYALVWHDSDDGTINFIRNDERPLWFAKLKNNQGYAWASEKLMLEWLLSRSKKGLFIEEMIELPVGVHYSMTLHKKSLRMNNPVKYTLPVFNYNYGNWGNYGGYGRNSWKGNSSERTDWKAQYQSHLDKYCDGVEVGDEITVIPVSFENYTTTKNKGTIKGYIQGNKDSKATVYLAGQCREDFLHVKKWKAKISSASEVDNSCRIFTKDVVEDLETDEDVIPLRNFKVTKDGTYISEGRHWEESFEHTCYTCGMDIQFEEVEDCYDIDLKEGDEDRSQLICGDCASGFSTH
jgi:hypothetical protein